jgi:hypothetical protein
MYESEESAGKINQTASGPSITPTISFFQFKTFSGFGDAGLGEH